MGSTGKEIDQKLLEMGKELLSPPTDLDELLLLLDQAESVLLKVEQSPSSSTSAALYHVMKAIVAKKLLRHSNEDVKIYVTSCLSEITRITAPDASYDDELMKEIFGMIVEAFKGLGYTSDRTYGKRLSILETVAKVRSCLLMLDLECDKLVLDMFHHFFNSIRENHPSKVFTAMMAIMTLVLEESEDISSELASCLLNIVKNNNKEVLPIAQSLAEKVIEKCASQLRSPLVGQIRSSGAVLSEYSKIVTDICQESLDGNNDDASDETLEDDSRLSDRTISEELPQACLKSASDKEVGHPNFETANRSRKSITRNGTTQMRNRLQSNVKPGGRHHGISKSTDASTRTEPDKLVSVSIKAVQSSDEIIKRRGRKKNMDETTPVVNETPDGNYDVHRSPDGYEKSTSLVSPVVNETPGAIHCKRGRPPRSFSKKEYESKSDSQPKSSGLYVGKVEKSCNDEYSKTKRRKRKLISEEDGTRDQSRKNAFSSPKNEANTDKDRNHNGECLKMTSKSRLGPDKHEDLDEKIVGASIKVWWPEDKRFYRGIIDSFDPVSKKHKVLYSDGDVEILRLKKERWEFLDNKISSDEVQTEDLLSSDPFEMKNDCPNRPLKKTKTSKSKQEKMEKPQKSSSAVKHKGEKAEPRTRSRTSNSDFQLAAGLNGDIVEMKEKRSSVLNDKSKNHSSSKQKFKTRKVISQSKEDELHIEKANNVNAIKNKPHNEESENDTKSQDNALAPLSPDDASVTSPKAVLIDAKSKASSAD